MPDVCSGQLVAGIGTVPPWQVFSFSTGAWLHGYFYFTIDPPSQIILLLSTLGQSIISDSDSRQLISVFLFN